MAAVIEVENLSKHFKGIQAVNQLSFTVNQGDIYGFLGKNGAGKSTTIRMLLTLIRPDSGSIKIFSKSLAENRNYILRHTGAIIEKPDMYKYLSAFDNLSIFARLSGIAVNRKILMEQLDAVGLGSRAESKVKTFSQGMKQRLGIAVALVHNPELIILDEPSNGLDPQGIADIRNMILQLRERGKTVLISSHLLSEIELIANRMIIIHQGKKIAEGSVSQLLDPSDTIVTIATTNDDNARSFIKSSLYAPLLINPVGVIQLKMKRNDIPSFLKTLADNNIGIISIVPRHSLEDYFISLTNTADA